MKRKYKIIPWKAQMEVSDNFAAKLPTFSSFLKLQPTQKKNEYTPRTLADHKYSFYVSSL
jgi:hypothetical protein